MIQVTGPAVVALLVIGYFGINSIIQGVGDLFAKKSQHEDPK